MKVFIDHRGDVHYVYNDVLSTENLGEKEVHRASNVEFDQGWQEWRATIPETHEIIAYGDSREEVIQKEIVVIEDRLRKAVFANAL